MKRLGAVALILIGLGIPSSADEFGTIVKSIESHYDVHQTDPHLIGFALFLAIPGIWEGGMDELKIASFKNEKRTLEPSLPELSRIMAKSLSPEWQPLLRLSSREKESIILSKVECRATVRISQSSSLSSTRRLKVRSASITFSRAFAGIEPLS